MRMPCPPCLRLLRSAFVLVSALSLLACDEPVLTQAHATDARMVAPAAAAAAVMPVDTTTDICEAPDLSTVLVPVPASGGGAEAIDVRVHYNRPDGAYGDWGLHVWQVDADGQYVADYPGVSWPSPLARSGIDDYGAYFEIEAAAFTHPSAAGFGFIVHPPGQDGDPGIDRIWKFGDGSEFWLRSNDATVYRSNPLAGTPDIDTVRVHYKRYDNGYDQWGLHLWPGSGIDVSRLPGLAIDQWTNPVPLSAMPNYVAAVDGSEVSFDLPVLNPQDDANRTGVEFVVHGMPSNPNGGVDNKDGWSDNIRVGYGALSIADGTGAIWLVQEEPTVFTAVPDLRRASTTDARAVWLTRRLLQWPRTDSADVFKLYHSSTGQIVARKGTPVGGADGAILLQVTEDVPADAAERFKWVGAGVVLAVAEADDAILADALKQQLVLVQEDAERPGARREPPCRSPARSTTVRRRRRGRTTSACASRARRTQFKLWAPTAQQVSAVHLRPRTVRTPTPPGDAARCDDRHLDRRRSPATCAGRYYRYVVRRVVRGVGLVRNLVTDPYSVSLDHRFAAQLHRRPRRRRAEAAGWDATPRAAQRARADRHGRSTNCTCATSRSTTRTVPRRASRQVPRLHRDRLERHAPPARAGAAPA